MAYGKSGVNIFFAILVTALAAIAATSIYLNSDRSAAQPASVEGAPDNPLPANHPDIGISQRIATLNEMIAKDPKNPEYQTQMGNLYYDVGQYEKAADHYQQSIALRPGNPNVETDLAVCFHYMGQDDKALEDLDKVLAHNPGFSQAMFNKGSILINGKKDVNAGISIWEELLRTDPEFARKAELEQKINKLKGSDR